MLTLAQLKAAMPNTGKRAAIMLAPLNAAMAAADINTRLRIAAFLSQAGHESLDFIYMREIASGAAYEGRKDLGNIQKGDGVRFAGRGPIQVTGRANYQAFSDWCGLDCVATPKLLEDPENGWLASTWFWMVNHVNQWADKGDIDGVSDVINRGRKTVAIGDSNGYEDRLKRYKIALAALKDLP